MGRTTASSSRSASLASEPGNHRLADFAGTGVTAEVGALDAVGERAGHRSLHARRIRIDHPDGGQVDVTGELPVHFAESLASLGFELAQGDLPLDEVKFGETPEGKRKAASAAAKSRRKERKGERRSRGRG